jgi:hypothetical protein
MTGSGAPGTRTAVRAEGWYSMDELVAVGTAGLIALLLSFLLVLGILWWIAARVWSAFVTGDWWTDAEILVVLVLLAAGYAATGVWLRKTGRI